MAVELVTHPNAVYSDILDKVLKNKWMQPKLTIKPLLVLEGRGRTCTETLRKNVTGHPQSTDTLPTLMMFEQTEF